jgi:hypothetical protein
MLAEATLLNRGRKRVSNAKGKMGLQSAPDERKQRHSILKQWSRCGEAGVGSV